VYDKLLKPRQSFRITLYFILQERTAEATLVLSSDRSRKPVLLHPLDAASLHSCTTLAAPDMKTRVVFIHATDDRIKVNPRDVESLAKTRQIKTPNIRHFNYVY
jgi:hypothetical protein